MAKVNQNTSAAQRRERERSQRTQQNKSSRNRGRGRSRSRRSNAAWYVIGGIIVVMVALVILFTLYGNQQKQVSQDTTSGVFTQLTHVDTSLLDQAGTGGLDSNISSVLKATNGNPPVLKGPSGKPELFYMGAEYCPYCAFQRWGLSIALSRFGTFSKPLTGIISSEDNVPTFSFYQGSYTSSYIDFVPKEVQDNSASPQNLESLSADEQTLVNTYDAAPYTQSAGAYPFIDAGNQFVSSGAYASPDLLVGKSYQDILTQIKDPSTDISRGVLGSANYITAQICVMTQNQPGDVCNSSGVQQVEKGLPTPSASVPTPQLAMAANQPAIVERKKVSSSMA